MAVSCHELPLVPKPQRQVLVLGGRQEPQDISVRPGCGCRSEALGCCPGLALALARPYHRLPSTGWNRGVLTAFLFGSWVKV